MLVSESVDLGINGPHDLGGLHRCLKLITHAFFSMAPDTIVMHALGAVLFFAGTILYGGIYWFCIELQKRSTLLLRVCTAIVFGFFIAFIGAAVSLMTQYPGELAKFLADPIAYAINLLGNTWDTTLGMIRFFEWCLILSMIAWNFNLGVFSVQVARRKRATQAPPKG